MRKFIALIVMVAISMAVFFPADASATAIKEPVNSDCNTGFLTFRPWYYELAAGSDCHIGTPADLPAFIWTIVLNILHVLFSIVGYLAVGLLIYGGYMYMLSRGQPQRMEKGKSTIINAVIGIIIALLASMIIALITSVISAGAAE